MSHTLSVDTKFENRRMSLERGSIRLIEKMKIIRFLISIAFCHNKLLKKYYTVTYRFTFLKNVPVQFIHLNIGTSVNGNFFVYMHIGT